MSKKTAPTAASETIKVVIRCRPMSGAEMNQGHQAIVEMNRKQGEIFVKRPFTDEAPKQFTFDSVYDYTASQ